MEPCRRSKRVSYEQLKLLWEFLNSNSDIVNSYNRSLQEKDNSKRKWREIAEILNSQGCGAHKDWKGWTKYWVDYKAKLKMKVAAVTSSHARIGGGPSSEKSLSEMDKKFLQLLINNFGQSLPGVKVDPFTETPDIDTELVVQPSESVDANTPPIEPLSQHVEEHIQIIDTELVVQPSESAEANTPPIEPLSQHVEEHIQIPPDPIPIDTLSQSSRPHAAQFRPHHSPRRRRKRRAPPMTIETARRALVQSSQLHAEATVKAAEATVKAAESLAIIAEKITSIERILGCAFPRAD
ncbi:unnamed protein product [Euphydryas editha]|uniref:Regulatory protein zeste n=1 Tax=Euphydryas editha TaxID=104508 RepID=A0AAU9ULP7_EUPED|nr:unnamed protein product [Euphydryas editha]